MGGGLMQLVAYGSQDIYLTGNPQITFWKAIYKRHTNFAMENIQQTFDGTPAYGQRASVTMGRVGDLVQQMYIRFKNTVFDEGSDQWYNIANMGGSSQYINASGAIMESQRASWPAEQFISEIELLIGGQRIDHHVRDWFRLYDNLFHTAAQKKQWAFLTCPSNSQSSGCVYQDGDPVTQRLGNSNNTNNMGNLDLPLIFSFNRHPGLALPLIALQYNEVTLNIHFTSFSKYGKSHFGPLGNQPLPRTELWANYIFLDTDERIKFAKNQHEYLIEQLQVQTQTTDSEESSIRLNFNHPVKELIWCAPVNRGRMGHSGRFGTLTPSDNKTNYQWTGNGTGTFNLLPQSSYGTYFGGHPMRSTGDGMSQNYHNTIRTTGSPDVYLGPMSYPLPNIMKGVNSTYTTNSSQLTLLKQQAPYLASYNNTASASLLQYTQMFSNEAQGVMSTCQIQLNGQDRFETQDAHYFNSVQPYQHHTGSPDAGIYVYSFAIKPEELQPSGTCNFSRINNATMIYTPKPHVLNQFSNSILQIYAVSYNIFRVMSGMGGLAYSN